MSSSPAIDAGVSVSTWGIVKDKDGLNRSMGARPDAGAYEYSGTASKATSLLPAAIAISATDKTLPALSATSLQVFPNPVSSSLTLQMNSNVTGIIKVQLTDISGRIIKELKLAANQGLTQFNLAFKELSAGLYSVRVQLGNWKSSQTIVKILK